MNETIRLLLDLLCPSGVLTTSRLADDLLGLLELPGGVEALCDVLSDLQESQTRKAG